MSPSYSLAGLIVGVAVGLTGIGGSALLAPMLMLTFGVPPSLTVGTNLLYSVPTKILACTIHARRGNVDWTIAKTLCIGGLPGALAGIAAFRMLRDTIPGKLFEAVIGHAIGAAVLIACVGLVITALPQFARRASVLRDQGGARWKTVAIGALVGFLVSLTSIGAGSVTLPLLALTMRKVALRRLVGSEIAFAAFLVPLAAIGHLTLKNVDWKIALALVLGSLPGAWLGSQLASTLGERWMRPVIVGLLAISGWKLV